MFGLMRAIYPVLRKYCLLGMQGKHYLQVNENKRRVPELSVSDRKVILCGEYPSPGLCCCHYLLLTRAATVYVRNGNAFPFLPSDLDP